MQPSVIIVKENNIFYGMKIPFKASSHEYILVHKVTNRTEFIFRISKFYNLYKTRIQKKKIFN